jgi:HD-GYP domain-containing protein (c-di-GMP phosphodiesterase class II)
VCENRRVRRVAELVGVLAMATDLGLGLPIEHAVRACLMGVAVGRRLGMAPAELSDVYYLTLLRMLGCTAGSADNAHFFADEVAFGRDTQHLDYGDAAAFGGWVTTSFAAGRPPAEREQLIGRLFGYTPERRQAALRGHCEVAQMLASRLGFGGVVVRGLAFVFERWDGTGAPYGVSGPNLPLAVRVMHLCHEVEIHHRLGGRDGAVAMARQRSGGELDPELVSAFCADPDGVLGAVGRASLWGDLLAAEPHPWRVADEPGLLEAARVMGDFADLKSAYLSGHSSSVAALVAGAAERLRLDPAERLMLHVGALAHDLGRVTVSTAVWDKPGPLNDAEWEAVRLHPYYSERMLCRTRALARAGELAGMHHERGDGGGYHRGTRASAHPEAGCVLAAADVYTAMRQARPHRPALDPNRAAAELRRLARDGKLGAAAVNAVLAAAGDKGQPVRRRWPADLTDREVDVLRRVALGGSIQEVAAELRLAPKTVDFHLQNIYSKAGVSTRAAAVLFAVQNDLLQA